LGRRVGEELFQRGEKPVHSGQELFADDFCDSGVIDHSDNTPNCTQLMRAPLNGRIVSIGERVNNELCLNRYVVGLENANDPALSGTTCTCHLSSFGKSLARALKWLTALF
jgi:hypothetical protein